MDIHKFDNGMEEAYVSLDGVIINSDDWNGKDPQVLKKEAPEIIEKKGLGKKTVNYKKTYLIKTNLINLIWLVI